MKAVEIMSTPAVSVTARTSVHRAANILSERGFSALPVVDHAGTLVGVVSEADLIKDRFAAPGTAPDGAAAAGRDLPAETVGEVMTSPPAFVDQTASLETIADTMTSGRRRSIPVVDGTRLVGVISRSDILRFLARGDAQLALDIRRSLRGFGDPDRWSVTVTDGDATILDDAIDRSDHQAVQAAVEAVPGVRRATVSR
jgi:CBS domain-containing protein